MTPTDTDQTLTEGDLIQWYRVEAILGRGGFGVTYLATDTNLDHRVAIKEYLPGLLASRQPDHTLAVNTDSAKSLFSEGLQRFLREARTLVKFRHPNIVRVMAVFEANNTAYLIMEYEEGEQFKEYVKRVGGVSEASLKSLMLSVIDGLDQVHQRGFIHRDIKPVNLIIRKDGSPVLLDFGSTRPVENDLNQQHTSFVSVGYTPLEQYQEGARLIVGPWTDIYSLGATLYYAISGVTPVSPISRLAALVKKSKDPLQPALQIGREKYSQSFLQAIDWALGFRIEDRPQTLSQWRSALEASQQGEKGIETSVHAATPGKGAALPVAEPKKTGLLVRNPETVRKPAAAPVRRAPGVRWLFVVIGLCAIVVLAASWLQRSQQQQRALNDLVERADSAFVAGDRVNTAQPLYAQILETDPDNPHALARLDRINDLLAEKIESDIQSGQFDQAEDSINQLESFGGSGASSLKNELQQQRMLSDRRKGFAEVQAMIDRKSYQSALTRLAELETGAASDDPRAATLKASAEAAIKIEQERQAKSAIESRERETLRLANQQRVAVANERERQRRRDYRHYLSSAEQALQSGEIESARRWLASASALQINDRELEDIEARISAEENFLERPLSDYELSYAREQFNSLGRAVRAMNTRAITELTEATSLRRSLFDSLFERYTQISVRIINVEGKLDPKRVTAVLRIERMVLPNGDLVYPSSSYRDTSLSLTRKRYSWSLINW